MRRVSVRWRFGCRTQAYRQFGNSVIVPLIRSIAEIMIPRVLTPEAYPVPDAEQQEIVFSEQAA